MNYINVTALNILFYYERILWFIAYRNEEVSYFSFQVSILSLPFICRDDDTYEKHHFSGPNHFWVSRAHIFQNGTQARDHVQEVVYVQLNWF